MKKTIDEQSRPLDGDRETRQKILEAARELFLARGYKGVSMKEVAEEVQVTSAALYYHFPAGKLDIFFSMMQMMIEEWARGVLRATESARGLREQLDCLTQYLFTLPIDRYVLLARDIDENVLDHGKKRMFVVQVRDTLSQHVTQIFQQAIDAGEIQPDIPASVLADIYEGMSISVLRSKRRSAESNEYSDPKVLANYITSVLLNGVSPTHKTKS